MVISIRSILPLQGFTRRLVVSSNWFLSPDIRKLSRLTHFFDGAPAARAMDATGLRALNVRFSPLFLRPRSLIRPSLLKDLRAAKPSTAPRSHNVRAVRSRPSLSPLSCSVGRGDRIFHSNGNAGSVREGSCDKYLQVVLFSPQIAGNTGSIARTCAASAVGLHLVEPLGYQIDDTKLKRAGLDYWPYVVVKVHSSWSEFRDYFMQQEGEKRMLAFTKKGTSIHSDFKYKPGDWLVFGSETSGLSPEALADCSAEGIGGGTIRIPMIETYVRCLNLSVSVGIALYEASRQLNYEQFQSPPEMGSESERLFVSEDAFG